MKRAHETKIECREIVDLSIQAIIEITPLVAITRSFPLLYLYQWVDAIFLQSGTKVSELDDRWTLTDQDKYLSRNVFVTFGHRL